MRYILLLCVFALSCAGSTKSVDRKTMVYDEAAELRKRNEFMLRDFGSSESNNMSEFFSSQAGQKISLVVSDVIITENSTVGVVTMDVFINDTNIKKSMYLITIFEETSGWKIFSIAAD